MSNKYLEEKLDLRHVVGIICALLAFGFLGTADLYPEKFWQSVGFAALVVIIGVLLILFLNKKRKIIKNRLYEPFNKK